MRHWFIWRSVLAGRIVSALAVAILLSSMACINSRQQQQEMPTTAVVATATSTVASRATAEPTPAATPIPTTLPTETSTPAATQTPKATQVVATATQTPPPTATAVPSPTPVPTPTGPSVTVGTTVFAAEIADTPELRSKGLGERDSLPDRTGMLFIFPGGQASSFWMKGMRFPLDFVWIGEDCTVVDLTENVQHSPPNAPSSELKIFESESPAAYTFEINAGEVSQFGVEIGDDVRFSGIESEHAMCCESGDCDGE